MVLENLTERDREIIFQCLNAVAKGNFLEHEFQTRLGLELNELKLIVAAFPNVDDSHDDSNVTLAINNCLNEVGNGINFSEREWEQCFAFHREEVCEVYQKWAKLRGWSGNDIM